MANAKQTKKRRAILSYDTNSKTVKGRKKGYATGILYLAPSDQSGVMNTCPSASKGCRTACLFSAGRGKFNNVKNARISKTELFVKDKDFFMECLEKDIVKYQKKAEKEGLKFSLRLNGTSDIAWENVIFKDGKNIFEKFPHIQAYDYTKSFSRMKRFLQGELPKNYHLTFSKSESNMEKVVKVLGLGGNVAVVFDKIANWKKFLGFKVVDGDDSDLRFLDGKNVVVGLNEKGDAKKDNSGFVVRTTCA